MKFEKIKSIKCNDSIDYGPAEEIEIGLKADDTIIMFGKVYFGQYMDNSRNDWLKNMESIIDEICKMGGDENASR